MLKEHVPLATVHDAVANTVLAGAVSDTDAADGATAVGAGPLLPLISIGVLNHARAGTAASARAKVNT